MKQYANRSQITVHCRTDSLEKAIMSHAINSYVHCRTGSLESERQKELVAAGVHCRTGSFTIR